MPPLTDDEITAATAEANANATTQSDYDSKRKANMAIVRGWYKEFGITRPVSDEEVLQHMRGKDIVITKQMFESMAKAETDKYTDEEKAAAANTTNTTQTGAGYDPVKLKAAWLAWTGAKTPAGLQQFLDANNKNGGFATGVTRTGSKLNQLAYNGNFLTKAIGSTDSNPYIQWDEHPDSGGGSTTTATASALTETPAQRSARLASFGLGPNGLQNQKPGEMPPAPTLGDMMGQQGPIANPGTYTPGAAYQAPQYAAPAPFAAPTAAEMGQDPGYQFRLAEGQRALENSGAARGVTNTGGNMKGLLDYGQQAASQEYGNVYNRNLNTYNTNAANAFQQYSTNALAGNTYNQDTEARKSGAFNTNSNLYQNQQTNAYNQTQKAYDDAMAAYQTKINNQRQYERDRMSDIQYAAGA